MKPLAATECSRSAVQRSLRRGHRIPAGEGRGVAGGDQKSGLSSTVPPDPLPAAAENSAAAKKFAAIEFARIGAGLSVATLCARVGLSERTYRRHRLGITAPRPRTLRLLAAALEGAKEDDPMLHRLWTATLTAAALDMGLDPRAVLAADPHANLKTPAWSRAMRARARAMWLVVTVHGIAAARAARAAGVSKQAAWKALRAIEASSGDDDYDDRLAGCL